MAFRRQMVLSCWDFCAGGSVWWAVLKLFSTERPAWSTLWRSQRGIFLWMYWERLELKSRDFILCWKLHWSLVNWLTCTSMRRINSFSTFETCQTRSLFQVEADLTSTAAERVDSMLLANTGSCINIIEIPCSRPLLNSMSLCEIKCFYIGKHLKKILVGLNQTFKEPDSTCWGCSFGPSCKRNVWVISSRSGVMPVLGRA